MTPSEWIGTAGVTLPCVLFLWNTHRVSMKEFKTDNDLGRKELRESIEKLFTDRFERVESEGKLRDEWYEDLQTKQQETSGKVKVIEFRLGAVERNCGIRHDPRPFPNDGAL